MVKLQRWFQCLQGRGDTSCVILLILTQMSSCGEQQYWGWGQDEPPAWANGQTICKKLVRGWGVSQVRHRQAESGRDGQGDEQVHPQSRGHVERGKAGPAARGAMACGTLCQEGSWAQLEDVTQPMHGPAAGQQIREACAGMLFLSGALEQEQWGFQASDAELVPLPSVLLPRQASWCQCAVGQAGAGGGGSSAPWAQGTAEPVAWGSTGLGVLCWGWGLMLVPCLAARAPGCAMGSARPEQSLPSVLAVPPHGASAVLSATRCCLTRTRC